jgi:hypothetical protein
MMETMVRVMVVEVPKANAGSSSVSGSRVKELLAEADPFITGLIRKLQNEVTSERASKAPINRLRQRELWTVRAEAPPNSESTIDFESPEEDEMDWPLLSDLERFE